MYIQRAIETIKEVNRDLGEISRASLEMRAEGLKRAVEEGWFKHLLIGGGIAGASLLYAGMTNDNAYAAGIGKGMLVIDGLYALGCYGLPALRRFRNRSQDRK